MTTSAPDRSLTRAQLPDDLRAVALTPHDPSYRDHAPTFFRGGAPAVILQARDAEHATAATATPGSSAGVVRVPVVSPLEGSWPPRPGSHTTANAMRRPATNSAGSGHHHRHVIEPGTFRQIHVDPMLQQVRQLEERPRNAGHHEPDSRCSDEEASILPAAHKGTRVDLTGVGTGR
jgi:hypothetical protein